MRFEFIDEHRDEFPITHMCGVLDVSPSGYYAWRDRPPSKREMANRELYEQIEAVYEESNGTYGSPRIYRELTRRGVACSENRVARLMRCHGLRAKQPNQYTTTRNPTDPAAPNVLEQDFEADQPDQKWLSDITYIPTEEGWLYLAIVLDLYSRRIVGWAMSGQMTGQLTREALRMALTHRRPEATLIHHSDQGSQYTASEYRQLLEGWNIQISMNGVGSWYDNAPMESFIGTLKTEWVHGPYESRAEARSDLFYYIEAFYNRRRLHSALGYLSPEEYEQCYYQEQAFA